MMDFWNTLSLILILIGLYIGFKGYWKSGLACMIAGFIVIPIIPLFF